MASQDDRRRVYMSFQDRNGWRCQFLERDLKTPLPRRLHFRSSEKVVELVERGGGFTDQESRLMLAQAIEKGRGGVFLDLTDAQYARLKRQWRQQRPWDLMPQGPCLTQSAERRATAPSGLSVARFTPIHQNIAADTSAPREVRARALLLAGCEEKLGASPPPPSTATRSPSSTAWQY